MILALTQIEKQVLYKKKRSEGFSHWDADFEVKKTIQHLKYLTLDKRRKRKYKNMSPDQIFKEEFAKLIDR